MWQQTFNSVKVSDSLDGIFTFSLSVIIIGFKTMWILPKALTLYHLLTVIHPINMHSLKIKKIHCWSSPSIERSTRLGENELMKGSFGYIRYGRWLWWAVSEWVWMRSGHHSNFCFCENSPSDRGWTALCSVTLRVVLLVAVQLVWVIGGHVGEILENVLVRFISCKNTGEKRCE